jgi:hypothetical protein
VGPQRRSGRCEEEKNFLPLLGIEPLFLCRPARSLVAIPTGLFLVSTGFHLKISRVVRGRRFLQSLHGCLLLVLVTKYVNVPGETHVCSLCYTTLLYTENSMSCKCK